MNNDKLRTFLEWGVAASMLLSLLMVILGLLVQGSSPDNYEVFQNIYNSPYMSALTVLICCLLILWITVGKGLESKLWKWLPPFLFFQGWGKVGRSTVVLALVVAMLAGIISDLFGN